MRLAPIIIVADDHPLFREALSLAIHSNLRDVKTELVHDISSLQESVTKFPQAGLILLDLHMPGAYGFSGLIYLGAHCPEIPVMVVSAHESNNIIRRSIDHGASGFLPKSSSMQEITEAINQVLAGNLWLPANFDSNSAGGTAEEMDIASNLASLTPQQFRVINMLAQGMLNKQIAYELDITEATIKSHITQIFGKLGVRSRTQAALAMRRLDVLLPGDEKLQTDQ